jgi:son of sevenless-like protein
MDDGLGQELQQLPDNVGKSGASLRALLRFVATLCLFPVLCCLTKFLGVYLTQLTFIQDGNPDNVNGLVNFSKRHKAAEVINDMKRWQTKNYALQPITGVLSFIEESLNQYSENPDSYKDHFWNMSLEREPREREDEKMARLLQESGFL